MNHGEHYGVEFCCCWGIGEGLPHRGITGSCLLRGDRHYQGRKGGLLVGMPIWQRKQMSYCTDWGSLWGHLGNGVKLSL